VLKLLKLARVSPKILDAYRAGELTLEHVQAFASSDDTERQEQVFEDFNPDYNDADDIRSELKPEGDIPATDKRAVYVGIEAYVKAGGKTRSDLFTDSTYLLDAPLLDELAAKKLAKSEKRIRAEGWAWVEINPDLSWERRNKFGRIYERAAPLPPELQKEYDALQSEADTLENEWYDAEGDTEKPERLNEIEERIEQLDDR
jgi:ParB family transcriptional regulator, chromosome partitioning protein